MHKLRLIFKVKFLAYLILKNNININKLKIIILKLNLIEKLN